MHTHSLLYIQTHAEKSVKSQLANIKEMSINKFIAFKATFFSPSNISFSLILPSFLVIPTALSVHTGKQDFLLYRKGFISAT